MLSPAHVLRNNQEVRGKALFADDLVFELEALADVDAADLLAVPILAVAQRQALLALATELALMRLAGIEQRVVGQDDAVPVQLDVALLGQLNGVVACLGAVREHRAHLVLGLHIELRALHAHAIGVVHLGVHADAHHDVLHRRVVAGEVVEVVCSDDLDAYLLGDLDQLTVHLLVRHAGVRGDAVLLDLDVEAAGLEQVAESLRPFECARQVAAIDHLGDDAGDTRRARDKALAVAAQVVQGDARLVVEAVDGRLGDGLHQVDVTGLVAGEQHHVVQLGLLVARQGVVRREIDLAAKDGLDHQRRLYRVNAALGVPRGHILMELLVGARILLRIGLLQLCAAALLQKRLVVTPGLVLRRAMVNRVACKAQLGDTVHVAVVGQRNCRHTKLDGATHHVLDTSGAIEHRILGVVVKVDECHVRKLRSDVLRIRQGPRSPTAAQAPF